MRLLSVDIQGFKSFAKRVHISFQPGITGVIGPNGSGKSNIAEALRWVLGEQSSKALRAKDRSDVIYAGEAGKASRATVTLTFDNESGRFPVAASEIAVTRSLTIQGESEYLINNEPIRLIDLQQMLAEAGIGAKSYTVISQGAVDRYLTATPQGRKELFDEATGIKSLQIKLNLSNQKLDKAKQHAEEVRTILNELSPRVLFLKRQVDRYDLREKYEHEFRMSQQLWYHNAWHNASKELERLQTAQATFSSRIQLARAKREEMEREVRKTLSITQTYETTVRTYNAWKSERDNLTESLAKTTEERKKAEQLLSKRKQEGADEDWNTSARSVLKECQECISAFIEETPWDSKKLHHLQSSLKTTLTKSDTTKATDITPFIQAVARLSAIEQERERQLKALVEPPAPTPEALESGHSHQDLSRDLEKVRAEEIQAEREDSAITSAQEQLRNDLALLEQEILRECGTSTLATIQNSLPETKKIPSDQELRTLSQKIASIGEKDPLVIKEYEEANLRFHSFQDQLLDIESTMKDIEEWIAQVTREMEENFQQQFAKIQTSFSKYFTQLFGGGKAELQSTPEGMDIIVMPPKKRPRHVALLSGGERTLTSLALLFAILDVQEPPFIVFDEVDAALDEANSKRFAELLQTRSHNTQSIVISHNRETMSVADVLYGVTMHIDGTSHLYSVTIEDIANIPSETPRMQV